MNLYCLIALFLFSFELFAADCEAVKPLKNFKPEYAEYFSIAYYDHYKIIEAGKKGEKERYLVADQKLLCETSLPVLTSQTKRFISTSTTHLYFLSAFNLESTLIGFQGVRYIYNNKIREQKIKEVSYQLRAEELLALRPDLVMAYTANVSVKKAQEMRRLKIPIVLNYDFEEKHPLARAEWIIFESAFFGKDKEAQELFGQIKTNYNELKRRATKFKVKKILVGDIQNGRWATCGEKSDLGILIKDAGGELVFKNETSQTQFMSLEKALKEKTVPDLWLAQNTWEKKESALKDSRYKKFLSLPIFNNTKKLNANGFSDFWETGIARPDLLLKDLLLIFHPQEVSVEETIWYKELK